MATIPADKATADQLAATEVNQLKDGSFVVDLNAGETINGATLPVPVFVDDTANEWLASDANDQARLDYQGFAISNGTDGNSIQVQISGIVGGFSGLDIGKRYYVQDAVGTIGTSIGTYEIYVGIAISATQILIDKNTPGGFEYLGSAADSADSITVPAAARFAIVHMDVVSGGVTRQMEVFVARKGKTTGVCTDGITGVNATGTATWSGSTIALTHNVDSISGTAYFYR